MDQLTQGPENRAQKFSVEMNVFFSTIWLNMPSVYNTAM